MRRCEVCDRPMIQQFPNDPIREWYWYCPLDGTFGHISAHRRERAGAVAKTQ